MLVSGRNIVRDRLTAYARNACCKMFEAVNNEALFRLQMWACFSTIGTRTEKAP